MTRIRKGRALAALVAALERGGAPHRMDITRDPPRPGGPPPRRVATFITGKLRGAKAQYLSGF